MLGVPLLSRRSGLFEGGVSGGNALKVDIPNGAVQSPRSLGSMATAGGAGGFMAGDRLGAT